VPSEEDFLVEHEEMLTQDRASEMMGVICSDAIKKVELLRSDFKTLFDIEIQLSEQQKLPLGTT
jgi:hypothetical protein